MKGGVPTSREVAALVSYSVSSCCFFSLHIEEDYAVVKRVLLGTKEGFITKELTGCVLRRANSVLQGMRSNICFKLALRKWGKFVQRRHGVAVSRPCPLGFTPTQHLINLWVLKRKGWERRKLGRNWIQGFFQSQSNTIPTVFQCCSVPL